MRYRRKAREVEAVQMPVAGVVTIDEKQLDVREGDYLLYNDDGTISGVATAEYFEEVYELAPPLPDPGPLPDEAPRRAGMWGNR